MMENGGKDFHVKMGEKRVIRIERGVVYRNGEVLFFISIVGML